MSEAKKLKEEFCVFFDVLGTKSKFLTSNFEEFHSGDDSIESAPVTDDEFPF